MLERLRANRHLEGVKLTMLTLVARAVVLALVDHPSLNSSWDEATNEIVTKHYVNLGIAVAGPRGLVVPNVKDAHDLALAGLASALESLIAQARAGRSTPADLSGGTITVTNVGVFGVDAGVPLLNPGEAAILAFGAVQRRPWEHEGGIALRDVVTLSLAFDHRLVDGEGASRASCCGRGDPRRPDQPRRPRLRPAGSPGLGEQLLQAVAQGAHLSLQVLELADEPHGRFPIERRGAGTQHGERAAQRLQLVSPLHHLTNICSPGATGKSHRNCPGRGRVPRPPLWCSGESARVEEAFVGLCEPQGRVQK